MPRELYACHMSLFPTKDSLVDVVMAIEEEVGPDQARRIFPLLMCYHNTLLMELSKQVANDPIAPAPITQGNVIAFPRRQGQS